MDAELASNITFSEHDRPPNTPRFSMEIESSGVVALDKPTGIIMTIRRAEDDCSSPCIFRWSEQHDGWGPSGFMLFQHTSSGLKKVEAQLKSPPPQTLKLAGHEVEEFLPGKTFQRNICSLGPFWDHLIAGEKYKLFWPGAEYSLWAWGTLREHRYQEMEVDLELPRVVIPGGVCYSFTCVEKQEIPDSQYDRPRVEKSERIPGTPCISVSLEGPSAISKTESLCITVKITYDGLTNEDCGAAHGDEKPIIIHDHCFSHDNFRLQRPCHDFDPSTISRENPTEWKSYFEDERNEGWMIVDEPDVEVNVTDSQFFFSLQPGESCTRHRYFDFLDLHPDAVVGDTYRYQYWGGSIDWWTSGDREEHASTVVKLPCWLNDHVIDPPDNDGRPEIVIPSSNIVEFKVVD